MKKTIIAILLISCFNVYAASDRGFLGALLSFELNEGKWQVKKMPPREAKGMLEGKLVGKNDKGYSISFWALHPSPKEIEKVKSMTALQHINHMGGMLNQKNKSPGVKNTAKVGIFETASFEGKNPSGMKFFMNIAFKMHGDYLVYIMHSYEPHRSKSGVDVPETTFHSDFETFVKSVKFEMK